MTTLTCIAPNCTASARTNKDLKFHRLPRDKLRREEWILLCRRPDLINESPDFFKDKSVCSLHFPQSMYGIRKLKRSARPSPSSVGSFLFVQDASTQTLESINAIEPTLVKTESTEVTTSDKHTEDVLLCAKTENDNTDTQFEEHKMECYEIENEIKIKEEDTELKDLKTNTKAQISTDSEDESEDEMSVDEFLQANGELENQIRKVLKKKNIPQIPIDNSKAHINQPTFLINKEAQTVGVDVYDIPKNNRCFQQCLRCGKNVNRLNLDLKPDRFVTLEEFEAACERFLNPTFCATVKNQIKLEQLLKPKDRRYKVFN